MENEPINYRLAGIEIVFKSLNQLPATGVGTKFNFELRVDMKVSAEHKFVIPLVTIRIKSGEELIELGNIGVSCLFEIENFEKHIVPNEKGLFFIPPNLEATLTPIAISTARGVMFSEFRGTYLNKAIMPVVLMTSLQKHGHPEHIE